MTLKRDPIQVDPMFRKELKALQKRIEMLEGKDISLRELTKRIVNSGGLQELEKKLLATRTIDVKINFDRRFLG